MRCRLFCFIIIVALGQGRCFGQDPAYSQVNLTSVYYNPANAGSNDNYRLTGAYRYLWSNIPGHFPAYELCGDAYFPQYNSALAFSAQRYSEGFTTLQATTFNLSYAYRMVLRPKVAWLQIGMQGDYTQKHFNNQDLIFSNQIDPLYGVTSTPSGNVINGATVGYFDSDAGALFRGDIFNRHHQVGATFNVGFAVHHILQPNASFTGYPAHVPMLFTIHANSLIPITHHKKKPNTILQPYIQYEKQTPSNQTNFGLITATGHIFGGVGYRSVSGVLPSFTASDAVIFSFGVRDEINKEFTYKIGYAYDATVGKLKGYTAGTHEIVMVLEWGNVHNHINYMKRIDCPSF